MRNLLISLLALLLIQIVLNQLTAQNCLSYNSKNSSCTSCASGYNLTNGTCILTCINNCSLCLTKSVCQACVDGYYLSSSNSTCTKCTAPCTSCKLNGNTVICNKCNNLDWDGSACTASTITQPICAKSSPGCPACGTNCKTCFTSSGKSVCANCVDNAVFNKTNQANCDCLQGYTSINNTCISCITRFGKYCTSCNSTNCLSCYSRRDCVLFPEKNTCLCGNRIQSNVLSVYQYNPITVGSNLNVKYFAPNANCYGIDSAGNCLVNCIDVYGGFCSTCYNGSCITNSTFISTSYLTCSTPGYYYNTSLAKCSPCSAFYSSCEDCSNQQCLLCNVNGVRKQCPCNNENMYLSDSDYSTFITKFYGYSYSCKDCLSEGAYCKNYMKLGYCSNVIPNCSQCIGDKCVKCDSGFFLDSNSTCQPCTFYSPYCLTCDSKSCYTCNETRQSPYCNACGINNCYNCKSLTTSSNICNYCYKGFYVRSSACLSCSNFGQCDTCNYNIGCEVCLKGYMRSMINSQYYCNALCNSEFDRCTACDDRDCWECEQGFFLNERNRCDICNSRFKLCSLCDSNRCSFCGENAEFNEDKSQCVCSRYYFASDNNCVSILYPILISVSSALVVAAFVYCFIIYYRKSRMMDMMRQIEAQNAAAQQPQQQVPQNQNGEIVINNSIHSSQSRESKCSDLKKVPTKEIPDDELCTICFARKADKALECFHILCKTCLREEIKRNVNSCPFCRRTVNFGNAINYIKVNKKPEAMPSENQMAELRDVEKKL